MVQTGWPEKVLPDGETASAKRTQRTMQAAGGFAVLLKLTQPRNRKDTDGDALSIAEASMEGVQEVCSGRSVGVPRLWHVLKEANLNSGDLIASLQEVADPQLKEGVCDEQSGVRSIHSSPRR
jgi:hypothetical protein